MFEEIKLTASQMLHKATQNCKWEVREITEEKFTSKKIISIDVAVLLLPRAVKTINTRENKRKPIFITKYPYEHSFCFAGNGLHYQ